MSQSDNPDSFVADQSFITLHDGGSAALADVFEKFRSRLRRMVEIRLDRRVAGRVDPSDVLQDVYMDASRQLESYLATPSLSVFLWLRLLTGQRLMMTHRHHLGVQKRNARLEVAPPVRTSPSVDPLSLSRLFAGSITSPSRAAMRNEVRMQLLAVLEKMDTVDCEILSLRHFEELSNGEVAQELGISTGAASKRYIRALERLREFLDAPPLGGS